MVVHIVMLILWLSKYQWVKSSSFLLFLQILEQKNYWAQVQPGRGWINTSKPSAVRCERVFTLVCGHKLSCCNKNAIRVGLTRLIHCFRFSMVTQYQSEFIVVQGNVNSQWTTPFMSQNTVSINFSLDLSALIFFTIGKELWWYSLNGIWSSGLKYETCDSSPWFVMKVSPSAYNRANNCLQASFLWIFISFVLRIFVPIWRPIVCRTPILVI